MSARSAATVVTPSLARASLSAWMYSVWELKIATGVSVVEPDMSIPPFPAWRGRPQGRAVAARSAGAIKTVEEPPDGRPAEADRGARGAPHCTSRHRVAAFSGRALEVPAPEGASLAHNYRKPGPLGCQCQQIFEKSLAGSGQRELAPPPCEELGAERAVGRVRELAVARDDGARLAPSLLEQARVAQQVDRAELGEPRLARAEELAGTA